MFTVRTVKTHPSAQALGFFDVELRVQWLEAKGNPLSRLAEWVETTDGAGYADSAYRKVGRVTPCAPFGGSVATCGAHGVTRPTTVPLSDEQKESNRQKSRIRARIEHVFGFMSQSMKGFYLRYIGRRRNAAAIGLINLIYTLARYAQIVRLKLRPRTAA